MTTNDALSQLSDADLLIEVKRLAAVEREATADLIRSLCEVEARQLHLAIGCGSMFRYCTDVLHLSEHAAYARIAAARTAQKFPLVMALLIEGAITLTTVTLLGRHLTSDNYAAVLETARHKSKADVEMIVATLDPRPDVASSVRKLPELTRATATPPSLMVAATAPCAAPGLSPQAPTPVPSQPAVVRPIAPERYKLLVTISAETRAKLRRAQDLLALRDRKRVGGHYTKGSGDEAVIIDRALTLLVEQLEKAKFAKTDRPRPSRSSDPTSRYVSAEMRRAVGERDGYRCAFVGSEGRCQETGGLEYHHRTPFADAGPTSVHNLELRCRAHNAYEAERWFGPVFAREAASAWGELGLDQVPRTG